MSESQLAFVPSDGTRLPFRIPSDEVRYFKQIVETDIEQLNRAAAFLRGEKPRLDVSSLSRDLAKAVDLEFEQVDSLVRFLWRLTLVKRRFELNLHEFIAALHASLEQFSKQTWSQEDRAEWEKRQQILADLLDPQGALGLGAKATELLWEQPLVLCGARVVTDLRPIFDDPAEIIQGFITFHTLILRCLEGTDEKEIHVAMDNNDVSLLKGHLERAEKKLQVIDAESKAKDVRIIPMEEPEGE